MEQTAYLLGLEGIPAGAERERALYLAEQAMARISARPAAPDAEELGPDQRRIHAIVVELLDESFEAQPDGTLVENDDRVRVVCRSWVVNRNDAPEMAQALVTHCQTEWPDVWMVVA